MNMPRPVSLSAAVAVFVTAALLASPTQAARKSESSEKASGGLYKCVDAAGVLLYTNQPSSGSNCRLLERNYPISTFTPMRSSGSAASRASPGDYPRVGEDQQKARDNDRRAILQQELANEQKLLDQAQKSLSEQKGADAGATERNQNGTINQAKVQDRLKPYEDKVALHQRNIESLQKELAR